MSQTESSLGKISSLCMASLSACSPQSSFLSTISKERHLHFYYGDKDKKDNESEELPVLPPVALTFPRVATSLKFYHPSSASVLSWCRILIRVLCEFERSDCRVLPRLLFPLPTPLCSRSQFPRHICPRRGAVGVPPTSHTLRGAPLPCKSRTNFSP